MRLILAALLALALSACGSSNSNSTTGDTVHFIRISGTELNGVELSDEDFEQLKREPLVNFAEGGNSGTIEFRLAHGDWVADLMDFFDLDEQVPVITIVTGTRMPGGSLLEQDRYEYHTATLTEQIIHGSSTEEYIDYSFHFVNQTHSTDDIHHVVDVALDEELFTRQFQGTRYLRFGRANEGEAYPQGSTRFPAVARQDYIGSRSNDLIRVSSYTIYLYRNGSQNAGFKVDLVQDPSFDTILFNYNLGEVSDFVSIYQVDTGRPARLQKVYELKDVVIQDPSLSSGSQDVVGEEVLSATFHPREFTTASLRYDSVGRYSGFNRTCTNIENGPQSCD